MAVVLYYQRKLSVQCEKQIYTVIPSQQSSESLTDTTRYNRSEKGTMLLIEPNPKQYVERGRFDQPDRSRQPAWPHPVIANGRLYLRDQDVLLCYDVKAK